MCIYHTEAANSLGDPRDGLDGDSHGNTGCFCIHHHRLLLLYCGLFCVRPVLCGRFCARVFMCVCVYARACVNARACAHPTSWDDRLLSLMLIRHHSRRFHSYSVLCLWFFGPSTRASFPGKLEMILLSKTIHHGSDAVFYIFVLVLLFYIRNLGRNPVKRQVF